MLVRFRWKEEQVEQSCILKIGLEKCVIGRDADCDFVLPHRSVSRKHAALYVTEQGLFIEDLESSFGTVVDFQPLLPNTSLPLSMLSNLKFGSLSVTLEIKHTQFELAGSSEHFSSQDIKQYLNNFEQKLTAFSQDDLVSNSSLLNDYQILAKECHAWLDKNAILHRINLMLNQALSYEELLAQVLPILAQLFGANRGFVLSHDTKLKKLKPLASYHFAAMYSSENRTDSDDEQTYFSQTIARQCFNLNEVIIIDDLKDDEHFKHSHSVTHYQLKSVVAFPLSYANTIHAIIYLDSQSDTANFNRHLSFLNPLQTHIGTALRHAIHYSQAITDDLTQLFTRRYFEGRIKQAMEHAKRYQSNCCLILLDIDHFKQVNDQHGHNSGDRVLLEIANILKKCARKSDVVGRLGGEEFVLLLNETELEGATIYAERLRSEIEALSINIGKETISVSASIGVSQYQVELGNAPYQFIERADKAMYQAKRSGRNCVVQSETLHSVSMDTILV